MTAPDSSGELRTELKSYLGATIAETCSGEVTDEDLGRIKMCQDIAREFDVHGGWTIMMDEVEAIQP